MHNRPRNIVWALVLLVGCTGGTKHEPAADQAPAANEASAPAPPTPNPDPSPKTTPPHARFPTPGPAQAGECPLAIVPGRALGPVQLGSTRAELEHTGLPLTQVHLFDDEELVRVGPYQAVLCDGRVAEAWLDDLRLAPDCASALGEPIPRDIPREDLVARFHAATHDCTELPPRIGGAFTQCAGGGLRLGYGMGEFLQIRVGLPGIELDDDCRHVLDDHSPVELSVDEFAPMLEQTIDLDALSPYWHPDLPGRRPLHVVLGDVGAIAEATPPAFNKFGSPVVYVAAAEATRAGVPVFELTRARATATTARLEFAYAAEGLVGSTTFRRRMDEWVMSSHELAER